MKEKKNPGPLKKKILDKFIRFKFFILIIYYINKLYLCCDYINKLYLYCDYMNKLCQSLLLEYIGAY